MIRDVHRYGSYLHLLFHAAKTAASSSLHTEFAAAAVITRVRKLSLTALTDSLQCLTANQTAVPHLGAAVLLYTAQLCILRGR